jgi:hypothetical protein
MSDSTIIDTDVLREQVREKYRAVAVEPHASDHFHTGQPLAMCLGYDEAIEPLPRRHRQDGTSREVPARRHR